MKKIKTGTSKEVENNGELSYHLVAFEIQDLFSR